jgi:hypothetical protein
MKKKWFYIQIYADDIQAALLHFLNSNKLQPGDFQVVDMERGDVHSFDVLYFAEKKREVE